MTLPCIFTYHRARSYEHQKSYCSAFHTVFLRYVIFEQLIDPRPVKNFPHFIEIRRFHYRAHNSPTLDPVLRRPDHNQDETHFPTAILHVGGNQSDILTTQNATLYQLNNSRLLILEALGARFPMNVFRSCH